jgi:hypothetical protein
VNNDNTNNPGVGWQILGEMELPLGTSMADALHAWLKEILHPLNLQAELINKIITSAQDAVARAVHAGFMHKFEHIHLMVFVPSEQQAKERTWGFFRLEKIEAAKEGQTDGDHAVELYLYGEGD